MNVPAITFFGIDILKFAIDFGNVYMLFLVVSLTLNLEAGYTGIPNFGKVMFVASGAAIAGSVCGRLAAFLLALDPSALNFLSNDYNGSVVKIIQRVDLSLSHNAILSIELILLGVLLAALLGAGLGFLASYPAIRLREDYLGMLLLASAQFFQIFLGAYPPLIGGTQGIGVPDLFAWAGSGNGFRDVVILGVLSIFAVLVYIYAESIARSPLGRTLRAVRDNEVASRALGKNDVAIRRNVIIVSSAISAIAGALLTFEVSSVGAGTWGRITWTFWIWVMVIIGGAANNLGVALGAFSFTFLFKTIDLLKFNIEAIIPFNVSWFEYLLFASLLILILGFRPGGILPEKSSFTLRRKTLIAIIENRGKEQEIETTTQRDKLRSVREITGLITVRFQRILERARRRFRRH